MTMLIALAAGVLSAGLYVRRRRWIDAVLVLLAALALAATLAPWPWPGQVAPGLTVITEGAPATTAGGGSVIDLRDGAAAQALPAAWEKAASVTVLGNGLDAAQLRDLPARKLAWQPPQADLLWLDFPRELALGRMFTLSAKRGQAEAGWRLQLLAENGQILAEARADSGLGQLSLQWLPPVAEAMVLRARLLDGAGKQIAAGPLPLRVNPAQPLRVVGRFDAPSFDARALNQLLAGSDALLDWQVTLGKAITRSETAREEIAAPSAMVVDAAWFERAGASARTALLAQVAQGAPLIVLGGNAANGGLWQRELDLRLRASGTDDGRSFTLGGAQMTLAAAPFYPAQDGNRAWSVLATDGRQDPWLWQRSWQRGRILWLGVADWHRYAINAPMALSLWWQNVLDLSGARSMQKLAWVFPDALPLPQRRSEICARGALPGAAVQVDGLAPASWLARSDRADAACFALWPQRAGWIKLDAAGQQGLMYVYAPSDWPAWQRALRRDATALYAARLPQAAEVAATVAPATPPRWPFAVLFALCALGLWWRERR